MCTRLPLGLSNFLRRRPVWKCPCEAWGGVGLSEAWVDLLSIEYNDIHVYDI